MYTIITTFICHETRAERAAWDFAAKASAAFSVTTILPPMVLGRNTQALSSPQDLNQSSLIVSTE